MCDLEDLDMPGAQSIAAFRILQGSLANILSHAKATSVVVRLQQGPGVYVLEIEDNGCGFEPKAVKHSLGLASMAERAELAGGTLVIDSGPGAGTRVVARFPVSLPASGESKGDQ
jgi:protein-histidine pros-kinase